MKSTHQCCICSQIRGNRENDLLAELIDPSSYLRRVPLETDLFAVIPSIGPLTVGHVLLCPKEHFKSFSDIPARYYRECSAIKRHITDVLRHIYNKRVHCFEHGNAQNSERPVCSVEHAHLHFVPTNIEVWPVIEQQL